MIQPSMSDNNLKLADVQYMSAQATANDSSRNANTNESSLTMTRKIHLLRTLVEKTKRTKLTLEDLNSSVEKHLQKLAVQAIQFFKDENDWKT
jgi:hypothetical protein